MERFAEVVSDRIGRNGARGDVRAERGEAVRETARRSPRNDPGHFSGIRGGAGKRCAIAGIGQAFVACDEGCAKLRRRCTRLQRRGDTAPVHDPARGDHRERGLADQKPGEGDHVHPLVIGVGIEHAAMPARFPSLRDDGIDAGGSDRLCFGKVGCRGEQYDPCVAEGAHCCFSRQAEMKTRHRRTRVEQHPEHGVVPDETAVDFGKHEGWNGIERREHRTKALDPRCLDGLVGNRGTVAEQIDVERAARSCAHLGNHRACAVRIGRTDRDRSECAGLAHRRGHGGRGDARHRRLDNGQVDADPLDQRVAGHHRSFPWNCRRDASCSAFGQPLYIAPVAG